MAQQQQADALEELRGRFETAKEKSESAGILGDRTIQRAMEMAAGELEDVATFGVVHENVEEPSSLGDTLSSSGTTPRPTLATVAACVAALEEAVEAAK